MDCCAPALSGRFGHWPRTAHLTLWAVTVIGLCVAHAQAAELTGVTENPPPSRADARLHEQLARLKNRPVLINFWATWCEPCREEMPGLQRLSDRWGDKGLAVVTVAVADNTTRVEDFLWEIGAALPVIHDHAQGLSRSWGARVLPTTLILDRRHRIRLRGQGAVDWDNPVIDQQLQPLLK